MNSSMATLDLNLIFVEILPRLPAKTLIRFKSVSKSFKSAITSHEFTKLYHCYQSLSTDQYNLVILPEDQLMSCYNINSSCTYIIPFNEFNCNRGSISVVGSCNGLVCLYIVTFTHYFVVHNPYIRMSKYVPLLPAERQPGLRFGFAFDSLNFDCIVVVSDEYHHESGIVNRFTRVYSFTTCKWSTVPDVRVPEDYSMEGRDEGAALINNHLLHWIFNNSSKEAKIGCFDVCKMKWTSDVLLPRYNHRHSLVDFGVFDECLFSVFENRVDSRFDVWVMKEYRVQDSWFKYLSIPISDEFVRGIVPITHRVRSGEVLIRQRGRSGLYWYNTADGGMRAAKFNEAPDGTSSRWKNDAPHC